MTPSALGTTTSPKVSDSRTAPATCPISGFHDYNIWIEIKGEPPTPRDFYKAAWLADGSRRRVLIAQGQPWHDTKYIGIEDDPGSGSASYEEMPVVPFLSRGGLDNAFLAARRARFEFGETPVPNLFSRIAS